MITKYWFFGFSFYALLGTTFPSLPLLKQCRMKTQEAEAHFYSEGYLIDVNNVPTLTNKYFEYKKVKVAVATMKTDYKELYKQFIIDAKVPFRPKGYTVNMYSLTGQKIYEKLLKTPTMDHNKLLQATMYYYRTTEYPKTIEKFLVEGMWENFYSKLNTNASGITTSPELEEPNNTIYL